MNSIELKLIGEHLDDLERLPCYRCNRDVRGLLGKVLNLGSKRKPMGELFCQPCGIIEAPKYLKNERRGKWGPKKS